MTLPLFLSDIEAKEREIAATWPGGYDRIDRVWLREEAKRRLVDEQREGTKR